MNNRELTQYAIGEIRESIEKEFGDTVNVDVTMQMLSVTDCKLNQETDKIIFSLMIKNKLIEDVEKFLCEKYGAVNEFIPIYDACAKCLSAYGSEACAKCTPEDRFEKMKVSTNEQS